MRMVARQTVVRVAVAALVGILAYAGIAGAAVRKPAKTSVPVPRLSRRRVRALRCRVRRRSRPCGRSPRRLRSTGR